MKIINKIASKVGVDKMLHFLVGALIVAQFESFGFNYVLFSFALVIILAILKEKLDNKFDWKDIGFSTLGAIAEFISFFLRTLTFY